ncbi:uncharacterized protein LOC127713969 [Mytilus californianus]|uniref:uncharacterized protein LOC127713969 n=1 Tax=Mytilus californianus TaxID=6549 RepID=UPI002246E85A|nr:uncharacterized protein LOC127713969 [Mytilus californianus]
MPSTSKSSEETQPIFWNVPATKILLAEIKKRDDATQKGKNTKKKMWLCIAEELASNGYKFTWEQVMGKWKTLITALKRTRDHNNRSGADKKSCAFQEELEEILGGNPTIEPSTTSGTKILNTCHKRKVDEVVNDNDKVDEVDNDNDKETEPVQPPKNEKKRRSGPSPDVVDFLKQYMEEQKKEREEEKAEKARMHSEKMNMFRELINEMKK